MGPRTSMQVSGEWRILLTCGKEISTSQAHIRHGWSRDDGIHDVPAPCFSEGVAVQQDAFQAGVAPQRLREHNAARCPHLNMADIQILQENKTQYVSTRMTVVKAGVWEEPPAANGP